MMDVSKLKKWIIVGIVVTLLAFFFCFLFFFKANQSRVSEKDAMKADILRLQSEEYSGMLLSSHETLFDEKEFEKYLGKKVIKVEYLLQDSGDVKVFFDKAWESGNAISNIILQYDPMDLFKEADGKESVFERRLNDNLLECVKARKDVKFDVLLPAPCVEVWNRKQGISEETKEAYRMFISSLCEYENVSVYGLGAQEWLIANPLNYEKDFVQNKAITQFLFVATVCDGNYMLDDADSYFEKIETVIRNYADGKYAAKDPDNKKFIFIGDSIFDNIRDSSSVSEVVRYFGNADVYNISKGGTSACSNGYPWNGIEVSAALKEKPADIGIEGYAVNDFALIKKEVKPDDDIAVIINYGFNDYLSQSGMEDFKNSYAQIIRGIRDVYPNCDIYTMSMYYVSLADELDLEVDPTQKLLDYVNALEEISYENNATFINAYEKSGINKDTVGEMLADGLHPNRQGCFALGRMLLDAIYN